ncbi:hypothetical protein LTR17_011959 [Elasticomyces elasticus]|nr:hypothetical protein LTR17_011959 [Elasticomyces elasticus]
MAKDILHQTPCLQFAAHFKPSCKARLNRTITALCEHKRSMPLLFDETKAFAEAKMPFTRAYHRYATQPTIHPYQTATSDSTDTDSTAQTASPATEMLSKTPCLQFGVIYALAGPSAAIRTLAIYVGYQASLKASQVAIASQFVLPNLDAAVKSSKGLDLKDYGKNHRADYWINNISLSGDAGPLAQTYWTGLSFWTMRNFGLKGPIGWQACVVATGFGTLAACLARKPREDVQEIRKQHDRVVSTRPLSLIDLDEYVPILQAATVLERVRNLVRSK